MFPLALTLLVLAKPWNGITPGVSSREDVVRKFGEPSKTVSAAEQEVLAYQQGKLIKGTTQTQFRLDLKSGVVQRIDVFPAPVLTLDDIANAYGPACTVDQNETAERPCYLKRADDKRSYVVYVRLGLAVFFNADGKTVQTFAFLPEKK